VIGADWTPHRRDDGELLGWIRPVGDDWAAVDLLGREASPPTEWLDAEAALEARGIAYLAEPWMLERAGEGEAEGDRAVRVRIVEVTPQRIVVKGEDFGAVDAHTARWELPWPLPARLRPPRPGDPDAFVIDR